MTGCIQSRADPVSFSDFILNHSLALADVLAVSGKSHGQVQFSFTVNAAGISSGFFFLAGGRGLAVSFLEPLAFVLFLASSIGHHLRTHLSHPH